MDSYQVVRDFEAAIGKYTGAPYVVTTNSCSMALEIALAWCKEREGAKEVTLPARTYCSVPMALRHLGIPFEFEDRPWLGGYQLKPYPVWDCARRFSQGMYFDGRFQCVSFQTSKILGIEQGGAILLDNEEAAKWLRRARYDGREAGEHLPRQIGWHCYLNPSTAALGLQKLACLDGAGPQCGSEHFEDLSKLSIW